MGTYRQPSEPRVARYGEIIGGTITSLSKSFSDMMNQRKANKIANQKLIEKNQIEQSKFMTPFEKSVAKAQKKQKFNETQLKQIEKYRQDYKNLHKVYGDIEIDGKEINADTRRAQLLQVANEVASGQGMIDGLAEDFNIANDIMENDPTAPNALDPLTTDPKWMYFLGGGWANATYVNPVAGESYYEFNMPGYSYIDENGKEVVVKGDLERVYLKSAIEAATGGGNEDEATQPFITYGDVNPMIAPLLDVENEKNEAILAYKEGIAEDGANINELNDILSGELDLLLSPTNSASPVNNVDATKSVYNPLFSLVNEAAENKNNPFHEEAKELIEGDLTTDKDDLEYGEYLTKGQVGTDAELKNKQERQQKLAALGYKLHAFKEDNPYGIQPYDTTLGELAPEDIPKTFKEEAGEEIDVSTKVDPNAGALKTFGFEKTQGSSTGGPVGSFGFTNIAKYPIPPKDEKEAIEWFKRDAIAPVVTELGDLTGVDQNIQDTLYDYKFNSGRDTRDLLLLAYGATNVSLELGSGEDTHIRTAAQTDELWKEHGVEIIKKIKNGEIDIGAVSIAKDESYAGRVRNLEKVMKNHKYPKWWGDMKGGTNKNWKPGENMTKADAKLIDKFAKEQRTAYDKSWKDRSYLFDPAKGKIKSGKIPTQQEFDKAWKNAKIGDEIKGPDGKIYKKT